MDYALEYDRMVRQSNSQQERIELLEQQLEHSKEMEKQSESIIKDLSEGYEALEQELAKRTEEARRQWTVATDWAGKHQILHEQNIVLLAEIRAKDALIKKAAHELYNHCDSHGVEYNWEPEVCHIATIAASLGESTAIQPTPNLLEARDKKRDAELLREYAKQWVDVEDGFVHREITKDAQARESGEWQPKLENL